MKHLRSRLLLAAIVFSASPVVRASTLDDHIRPLFSSPLVKGALISLSVVEVTTNGPTPLYNYHETLPLGPASNCKLLTTAAAFEKYGSKAAFKTNLFQIGEDLVLVGGGDPALGDAQLPEQANDHVTAPFEKFAATLKSMGITHYKNLIVDDRVFDQQWVHPNWPADQRLDWYSAPIGGLSFNLNCLDWMPLFSGKGVSFRIIPETTYVSVKNKASRGASTRVSMMRPSDSNEFEMRGTVAANPPAGADPYSVPIYDPGMWTGTILRDTLAANGITSTGSVRRVSADEKLANGRLVASHETPLLSVINRANKNSINMMAESLCKRLGHDATGASGSWTNGTAAVEAYLQSIGISPDLATLDDGSGLSNKNRVAAKAFVTVLSHVGKPGTSGDLFVKSLAEPGEDGTLKRRFRNMAVAQFVHAKTGHISGVSTLSGYIDMPGRRFAFSILCNKYQGNVNPWQDDVCQAIYAWATGK